MKDLIAFVGMFPTPVGMNRPCQLREDVASVPLQMLPMCYPLPPQQKKDLGEFP